MRGKSFFFRMAKFRFSQILSLVFIKISNYNITLNTLPVVFTRYNALGSAGNTMSVPSDFRVCNCTPLTV